MVAPPRAPLRTHRLRALNTPVRIEVEVDGTGTPRALAAPPHPGQQRRVEEILESWRIDDEWWRAPIARRYLEIVLQGGGHVVVFQDLITNEWFLQKP